MIETDSRLILILFPLFDWLFLLILNVLFLIFIVISARYKNFFFKKLYLFLKDKSFIFKLKFLFLHFTLSVPNLMLVHNGVTFLQSFFIFCTLFLIFNFFPIIAFFVVFKVTVIFESLLFSLAFEKSPSFQNFIVNAFFEGNKKYAHYYFTYFFGNMFRDPAKKAASTVGAFLAGANYQNTRNLELDQKQVFLDKSGASYIQKFPNITPKEYDLHLAKASASFIKNQTKVLKFEHGVVSIFEKAL